MRTTRYPVLAWLLLLGLASCSSGPDAGPWTGEPALRPLEPQPLPVRELSRLLAESPVLLACPDTGARWPASTEAVQVGGSWLLLRTSYGPHEETVTFRPETLVLERVRAEEDHLAIPVERPARLELWDHGEGAATWTDTVWVYVAPDAAARDRVLRVLEELAWGRPGPDLTDREIPASEVQPPTVETCPPPPSPSQAPAAQQAPTAAVWQQKG